jgi:hypothetical protein
VTTAGSSSLWGRRGLTTAIVCAVLLEAAALVFSGKTLLLQFAALGISPGRVLVVQAMACIVAIPVHEMSHALAGPFLRIRPVEIGVGPLLLRRDGNRLRLGYQPFLQRWGGYVLGAVMPGDTENLRQRLAALAIAGPIGSVLFAVVAFLLSRALETAAGPWAAPGIFLHAFAVCSFGIALVTTIPMRAMPGRDTDGGQFIRNMVAPEFDAAEAAAFSVRGAALLGQRPRDWDHDEVARAATDSQGRMFAYYHALDTGDMVEAGRHLKAVTEMGPGHMPPHALHELVFFEAVIRGDRDAANKWAVGIPASDRPHVSQSRARAALHFVNGEADAALSVIAHTRRQAERGGNTGLVQFELDLLDLMERRATPRS